MKQNPSTTMKLTAILLALTSCAAFAATEEQLNKKFEVAPGGTIVVDVDFGAIDIATNSGSEVTVDVWRKITRKSKAEEEEFLQSHPVSFAQDGNAVTVRCRHQEEKSRWFKWGGGNRNEGKYTVAVPAQFNAKLNTSGGPIAVSDLTGSVKADTSGGGLKFTRLHGPLDGDTSGGGIRATDCEGEIKIDTSGGGIEVAGGGGSLHGETSGGGVTVKNFRGPASVETSGGGITLENIGGTVHGETSGGPINAVLPSPIPGDVKLETSGGGVTVKVPADAAFNLDAETSGGSVTCDLPITIQGKKEHGELKGAVNGGGPTVKLESSGGGIHVKKP
jgi:DUF4097 and DUF4098 domain-containing protein YvlB